MNGPTCITQPNLHGLYRRERCFLAIAEAARLRRAETLPVSKHCVQSTNDGHIHANARTIVRSCRVANLSAQVYRTRPTGERIRLSADACLGERRVVLDPVREPVDAQSGAQIESGDGCEPEPDPTCGIHRANRCIHRRAESLSIGAEPALRLMDP